MSAASGQPIRVLKRLGKRPKLGPVPGDLVAPWGLIGLACFLLWLGLHYLSGYSGWSWLAPPWVLMLLFYLSLCNAWLIVADPYPSEFLGRFHTLPKWGLGYPQFRPRSERLVSKMKVQKAKVRDKTLILDPLEKEFELKCFFSLRIKGRHIGGYLLQTEGGKTQATFVAECEGIQHSISATEAQGIAENLDAALKELPYGEFFTIYMSSTSSDAERQAQLLEVQENAPQDELKFLTKASRRKVRQLARKGIRKPKTLRFYMTYTSSTDSGQQAGWLEKPLTWLESVWLKITDPQHSKQAFDLENFLNKAFNEGYLPTLERLESKAKLRVRFLNEQEIWDIDTRRLGSGISSPVPQVAVLNREGLHWEINSQTHLLSYLFADNQPTADRQWVHLPSRGYCGGVVLMEKHSGWKDHLAQLLAGSNLLHRWDVADTEIICQLSRANEQLITAAAQQLTKQSNAASNDAYKRARLDVGADYKRELSIEVERALLEGAVPVHAAWLAIAYRPNPEALAQALGKIKEDFSSPARAIREINHFHTLWVESTMYVMRPLLENRRQVWLTREIFGTAPLLMDCIADKFGVELYAEHGGTPLPIDIFTMSQDQKARHMMILGGTGAGKSLLAGPFIIMALALGWEVFIIDSTRGDGSGTFDALTEFVGGAYFNTRTESYSLFERPPGLMQLRESDLETFEERFALWRDTLKGAILTLAVGNSSDETLKRNAEAIIDITLTQFLEDRDIQQRYDQAEVGGMDNPETWQAQPVLRDYLEQFLVPERLAQIAMTSDGHLSIDQEKALADIRLQISSVLHSSLGKAIGKPSTFKTDKKLTVYALADVKERDAMVLALSAYSSALSRSLTKPNTLWFIDESSILLTYDSFSEAVGGIAAKGRKAGIRLLMSAQGIGKIALSKAWTHIQDNVARYLIGFITEGAAKDLEKYLSIPLEVTLPHTHEEQYKPRSGAPYTRWLMRHRGRNYRCHYHMPPEHLALLANAPPEVEQRQQFKAQYPNKYEWVARLGEHLVSDRKQVPENIVPFRKQA